MRKWLVGIGWLFVFWLAGCKDDGVGERLIARAEAVFATAPDSARALLDSVALPEELGDRSLTHWCTLYGRVADTLYIDLPYPEPFRQAYAYLRAHGTRREQARMGLYLGRAYAADKEYERAMKVYLQALDAALACEDYNQAGYISSYTADLYDYEENYLLAKEKYAEAETYFRQAGNMRSAAYALRDQGQMYVFVDSAEVALPYILRADTILTTIGDSSDIAYISNALGNVYKHLGDTSLAKRYFWKAIQVSNEDVATDYCALADVYIEAGDFFNARICLEEVSNISSLSDVVSIALAYNYYQLEKAEGNLDKAISYLEAYNEACDSIYSVQSYENVAKAEKKYEHLKVSLENTQLKEERQLLLIHFILALIVSFLLLVLYLFRINHKNRLIYQQNLDLERRSNAISRLQDELRIKQQELKNLSNLLSEKNDLLDELDSRAKLREKYERLSEEETQLLERISEQRKDLLQSSAIARRLEKLSRKVMPGTDKPPLTEKDWQSILSLVDSVYPSFSTQIAVYDLTPAESRYCYLALFHFDAIAEARLLNILPDSVNKRRQRVRQKLGITGKEVDLYAYLIHLA